MRKYLVLTAVLGLFAAACTDPGTQAARNDAAPARNDAPAPPAPASPAVANAAVPAANNAPAANTEPGADQAPRISLADAKAAYDAGDAVFVDSRAESAYKAEHIKGAINIPGGTLDSKIKSLPKNKKIIVYCS